MNKGLAALLGLSERDVGRVIEEQLREVYGRSERLRAGRPYPSLDDKRVVLVDDGVAAGYTMRAALGFVRDRGAEEAVVAVPMGHLRALESLLGEADVVICLNVRSGPSSP